MTRAALRSNADSAGRWHQTSAGGSRPSRQRSGWLNSGGLGHHWVHSPGDQVMLARRNRKIREVLRNLDIARLIARSDLTNANSPRYFDRTIVPVGPRPLRRATLGVMDAARPAATQPVRPVASLNLATKLSSQEADHPLDFTVILAKRRASDQPNAARATLGTLGSPRT